MTTYSVEQGPWIVPTPLRVRKELSSLSPLQTVCVKHFFRRRYA